MHEFWIQNNMSFLYRYWSTARSALEAVANTPEAYDEFKDNKLGKGYVDAVISSHFEHHGFGAVLLAYAAMEEFLAVLTQDLRGCLQVTTEPSDLRDRGLRRYRTYIQKVCAITAEDLPVDWKFLDDFTVIRNCIVHGNGNKARVGNPREVDRVVDAYPRELGYRHDVKLVVSDEFVARCMAATAASALAINRFMIRRLQQGISPDRRGDSGDADG